MLRNVEFAVLFGFATTFLVGNVAIAAPSPPSAGYIMGLNAATGVSTTGGAVTGWNDEATSVNLVGSTAGTATTVTTTFQTPNGLHSALVFDGSAGLTLNNASALSIQNLSIFVVGSLTSNNQSAEFIANFSNHGGFSHGWADGISDSSLNQTKWFTGPDGSDSLGGTTNITLNPGAGPNNAYLLFDNATVNGSTTTKSATAYSGLFLANMQTSTPISDTVSGIPYETDGSQTVGVGYLGFPGGGAQPLIGDIAEILVYDNSIPGFNAASVRSYLEGEFFATPEPSSVISGVSLFSMAALGLLIKRRRRNAATAA